MVLSVEVCSCHGSYSNLIDPKKSKQIYTGADYNHVLEIHLQTLPVHIMGDSILLNYNRSSMFTKLGYEQISPINFQVQHSMLLRYAHSIENGRCPDN